MLSAGRILPSREVFAAFSHLNCFNSTVECESGNAQVPWCSMKKCVFRYCELFH